MDLTERPVALSLRGCEKSRGVSFQLANWQAGRLPHRFAPREDCEDRVKCEPYAVQREPNITSTAIADSFRASAYLSQSERATMTRARCRQRHNDTVFLTPTPAWTLDWNRCNLAGRKPEKSKASLSGLHLEGGCRRPRKKSLPKWKAAPPQTRRTERRAAANRPARDQRM
jgi:hypothetical protein